MLYTHHKDTFIIHVQQDEKIMDTLTQFCKDKNINNGEISGIGAIKDIELGAYDLENKKYIKQTIESIRELTSFQGNIQLKEGEPFIHAHIHIADHDLMVLGGHLFEATVAAVGEFILRKIHTKGYRELDNLIGLPVMCLIDE